MSGVSSRVVPHSDLRVHSSPRTTAPDLFPECVQGPVGPRPDTRPQTTPVRTTGRLESRRRLGTGKRGRPDVHSRRTSPCPSRRLRPRTVGFHSPLPPTPRCLNGPLLLLRPHSDPSRGTGRDRVTPKPEGSCLSRSPPPTWPP